jgi:hypothetical protein
MTLPMGFNLHIVKYIIMYIKIKLVLRKSCFAITVSNWLGQGALLVSTSWLLYSILVIEIINKYIFVYL